MMRVSWPIMGSSIEGLGSIHQPLPTVDLCLGHTGAAFLLAVAL